MMLRNLFKIFIIFAPVLFASCNPDGKEKTGAEQSEGYTPVPKRYAYPRIQLPDSSFSVSPALPLSLQVNDAAKAEIDRSDNRSVWVNVSYPSQQATIHYTFTTVDNEVELNDIIENRLERIGLNIGSNDYETISFETPAGFKNNIFVSAAGNTPVQFIAYDGLKNVVSGMAWLPYGQTARPDSISPIVEMLQRDVIHSLKTLQP